jgi:hypothetical protein
MPALLTVLWSPFPLHSLASTPASRGLSGLDKQVTHHLFPRIPRHNLRAASLLVKKFCKEQEIEYAEYGWAEGNARVLGVVRFLPSPLLRSFSLWHVSSAYNDLTC